MKPHELFEKMSPALAAEIFNWMRTTENETYKAAIQGLANQRNLRPQFVERKPPAERHAWMQHALSRKISNGVAEHIVQAWLLGAHKQMLCDFLDSLGIPHGEDGTVDDIPASPSKDKVAQAVEQLLNKHPLETVAIYLHAFQNNDEAKRWAPLDELLREEPRLQLQGKC
jgi:hypothetical protein